ARAGARAGAVTSGTYGDVVSAVDAAMVQSGMSGATRTITVTVNGNEVTSDSTFAAAATPGATVSVQVRVPYSSVTWLPAGVGMFIPANQMLTETAVLSKEG